jgi:hypothetical protein
MLPKYVFLDYICVTLLRDDPFRSSVLIPNLAECQVIQLIVCCLEISFLLMILLKYLSQFPHILKLKVFQL